MTLELVVGAVLGLLAVWLLFLVLLWVLRPRDARLADLVRVVPDIVRLASELVRDPAVPMGVRVTLGGLAAWLVSPIDLVPEFIPVLGPIDDVVVAVLALRYVRRRLGEDELRRRWRGTDAGFELLMAVAGGRGEAPP